MLQQAPTSHQLESFLQCNSTEWCLQPQEDGKGPLSGHLSDCVASPVATRLGTSTRCSAAPTTATAPFARLPGGPSSARCSSTSPVCLVIDTDGEEELDRRI
ncbi:unnamed protein product [Musa textilis]